MAKHHVPSPGATIVVRAARIRSMSNVDPEAFVVVGGAIVDSGAWDTMRARFPAAEPVDFGSATVIPGLNDAHAHPSLLAEGGRYVELAPAVTPSAGDVRAALTQRAERTSSGEWVIGHNFDISRTVDGGTIDRAQLDAVSDRHPVLVIHYSYHAAVANSAALRAAGYTDATPDPAGGGFGRDAAGRLDGVVYERAWMEGYLGHGGRSSLVPAPVPTERIDPLSRVLERFHAAGVTSVCDAMVHPSDLRLYQATRSAGRLTARIGMLLWYEFFDHAQALGMSTGFGDPWLRLSGVKMITDGASSAGTCRCATAAGVTGIQVMSDDEIELVVRRVHEAGSTLAVHANGDIAVRKVLDAIETAQRRHPSSQRHRIEHCTMTDPATARRLYEAAVVPVPFGAFPRHHGKNFVTHYGPEIAAEMCPHRTFLDAGLTVPGSSDYPCGPLDPLLAFRSMTTRQTQDGTVIGADQRISTWEALRAYTVGSAYASGEESVKGRLVPGQLADFVVLSEDPLTTDPGRLDDLRVLSTWVGGRPVWSTDPSSIPPSYPAGTS